MKQTKPRNYFYLTRTPISSGYILHSRKRGKNHSVDVAYNSFLVGFCPRSFERATGIKLNPGETVKLRISFEILEVTHK